MEMTRKSPASSSSSTAMATEEEATSLLRPAATPFSSETERRRLERAYLPPPSPSPATEWHEPTASRPSGDGGRRTQQRQRQQQEQMQMQFVPTAVPIPISDQDELARNLASAVAVATPIPATTTAASSSSTASSSRATTPKTDEHNKNNTHKHDDHSSKTEHDSEILVRPSPPTPHTPTHAQDTTRRLLRRAQLHGTLSSESEKEDIRRAQRERNALRYHAARAVEAANEAAARRERGEWTSFGEEEGRGREGELDGERRVEEGEESARRFGTILANGERGYEVAEYDIGEDYEVQEYDVAEYKSVYE